MRNKLLLFFFSLFALVAFIACQNESTTTEELITTEVPTTQAPTTEVPTTEVPTTEEPTTSEPENLGWNLVDNPQDGLILHAWNWSLVEVEERLEEIAIAGFSTVQISPLQPQKDFFGASSWGASWWKLYQPLGFSIATENHSLGTVDDLISLTEAANEYGIKIIVDIVANHLAGGSSESLNSNVEAFEPDIYQQNLIRTGNGMAGDSSIFSVTRGSLGEFPDLLTENTLVQARVLQLLKDYVDAGVSGFRFDAAKHIETPNDGEFASDFWPTIINGIMEYADTDIYIYGEILNTPGRDRQYSDYTPYMSITMNGMSDNIRTAVLLRDTARLDNVNYHSQVNPNQTVLWAESHDDYAAGHTDGISNANITKAYVIAASRADATTLYFARPNQTTFMGEVGSYLWQSKEVSAINHFHNYFSGTSEYISTENGFFINERYGDDKEGVVIVNVGQTGTVDELTITQLSDGTYRDQISGNMFTVFNGKISGTMGQSGIAVIYNNPNKLRPTVYVSDTGEGTTFSTSKTVTIYSFNTTSATYSINGQSPISFVGDIEVLLTHPELNGVVTLTIDVYYDDYHISKTYEYVKSNVVIDEVIVNNLDSELVEQYRIVAWTWKTGQDGEWVMGVYQDGTFTFDLPLGNDYFLLVLFPADSSSNNWSLKVYQTGDIKVPNNGIYDGSNLTWS